MENQKGFTLIELLVVISVIGLLASVVLVSLNTARSKARDAKRMADLQQIAKALELYYNDKGYYPPIVSLNCTGNLGGPPVAPDGWNQLKNALVPNYASSLPSDPGSYSYFYCADGSGTNSQEYGLRVQVETNPAVVQNSFHGIFYTSWGFDDLDCSSSAHYCITVCRNAAGQEGPIDAGHPNGQSWSPPNCGTY